MLKHFGLCNLRASSFFGIATMLIAFASCESDETEGDAGGKGDYDGRSKVKEVWIWDRVEYKTDWGKEVYSTEEEFRDYFFYYGEGSHSFVIPYAFVFYKNGYYDFFEKPYIWQMYLKDFKDGDGPSRDAQLWKIEDSYFYTTWSKWKAEPDDEFGKAYKIVSNSGNSVVLKPIYGAINYGGGWGDSYYEPWTVTLKKKKYSDCEYDPTVWW